MKIYDKPKMILIDMSKNGVLLTSNFIDENDGGDNFGDNDMFA